MAFNPYGSFLDFSIEDWSLDSSELQSSNVGKKSDTGKLENEELPFSADVGEENNEGNVAVATGAFNKGTLLNPSTSVQSQPETSVTEALTEPNESFSFEINLPPGVEVSPLSCKESVIAMMMSRSVDRALDAPPPLEIRTPSSPKKNPRTRSKSRPRASSQIPTSSPRRKERKSSDDRAHMGATSQVSGERKARSQSKDHSGRRKSRASSKERTATASPRLRSKSSDPATLSHSNQMRDRDRDERRRRKTRSKSSAPSKGTKAEERRRRSPSRQRVVVSTRTGIMEATGEDMVHPGASPRQRRSPSRSRNRSKSRARHRSTSRAPSQGPRRDATSSPRARSTSRHGVHKRGSEGESRSRPLRGNNCLPAVEEFAEEGVPLRALGNSAQDDNEARDSAILYPASTDAKEERPLMGLETIDQPPSGNEAPPHHVDPASAFPSIDRHKSAGEDNIRSNESRRSASRRERSSRRATDSKAERTNKWSHLREMNQVKRAETSSKAKEKNDNVGVNVDAQKHSLGGHDQQTSNQGSLRHRQPDCVSIQPKIKSVVIRPKGSSEIREQEHSPLQRTQPLSPFPPNSAKISGVPGIHAIQESANGQVKASITENGTVSNTRKSYDNIYDLAREVSDETTGTMALFENKKGDSDEIDPYVSGDVVIVEPAIQPPVVLSGSGMTNFASKHRTDNSPRVPQRSVSKYSDASDSSTLDRLEKANELIRRQKQKKEASRSRQKTLEDRDLDSYPFCALASKNDGQSGKSDLEVVDGNLRSTGYDKWKYTATSPEHNEPPRTIVGVESNNRVVQQDASSLTTRRAVNRKGNCQGRYSEETDETPETIKPTSTKWKVLSSRLHSSKKTPPVSSPGGPKNASPSRVSKWGGLRTARDLIAKAGRQNEPRRRLVDDM